MLMDEPARSAPDRNEITDLLQAHARDPRAMERLVPVLYDELHQIAHQQLGRERPGHTLQTTALVHEAFVKLVGLNRIQLKDRDHFFALSARLMRQILTDYARRRRARGGDRSDAVVFDTAWDAGDLGIESLLDLDEALEKLRAVSERQLRVVECRFFAGMTVGEIADALGISLATVKRDWQLARAWLNRELA